MPDRLRGPVMELPLVRRWPMAVQRDREPVLEAGDVVWLWRDNPYKGTLRAGKGYVVHSAAAGTVMLKADNNTEGWFRLKYFVHGAPDPGVSRVFGKNWPSRGERLRQLQARRKMNKDYAQEYEMIMKAQNLIGE